MAGWATTAIHDLKYEGSQPVGCVSAEPPISYHVSLTHNTYSEGGLPGLTPELQSSSFSSSFTSFFNSESSSAMALSQVPRKNQTYKNKKNTAIESWGVSLI